MEYDKDKVDEMALALLYLVTTYKEGLGARAWPGFDSSIFDRLHEKGWIGDPRSKGMTLEVTEEGFKKSEELFLKYFGQKEK